jgi:hypothetical protein
MAPQIVFIVPYRDRAPQLNVFMLMMKYLMEDYEQSTYEICIAHQKDKRPFNRGAIKNLGFMAIRDKYPKEYQDITFVFHDVDTFPCWKGLLNYKTNHGNVKHFYGFKHTLGGIVSMTGRDFERINGFPCLWSYGYEDNILQNRCLKAKLNIDRSVFFPIGHPYIFQSVDHFVKSVNRNWKQLLKNDDSLDGIGAITNVSYSWDDKFVNFVSFTTRKQLSEEDQMEVNMLTNKPINSKPNVFRMDLNVANPVINNTRQEFVVKRNQDIPMPFRAIPNRAKFMRRGGLGFMTK